MWFACRSTPAIGDHDSYREAITRFSSTLEVPPDGCLDYKSVSDSE